MYILGINAYHGDAAAAIIKDGELLAAVEEERFNRKKHCAGFPASSIEYCLSVAGIGIQEVDHIGISRDPCVHLHKKILFSLQHFPGLSGQIASRLANAAKVRSLKGELARALGVPPEFKAQFHNIEHHKAHMASSFLLSGFERAAILSIDGFGDFISTMWGLGEGNRIEVYDAIEYPHSAGIVYTATSQYLGFPKYGDEGKVMGLAPYGRPQYVEQFREIVRTVARGRFKLNLDYFLHHSEGVDMTWDEGSPMIGRIYSNKFLDTFGPARQPGEALTSRHQDIAASLQLRLEEISAHILKHLHEQTGSHRLCLAGGVAYNSVMNGKILLNTPFTEVFVQPAAGDAGTALGVCYHIWNALLGQPRSFVMEHAYTGPEYVNGEIESAVLASGLKHRLLDDVALAAQAAQEIAAGKIVGWFQGRMEFGPRALGNRSIVVDPRRAEMKDVLNARIKKREPFRPFAPSILEERVGEYFEQTHPAPSMLMVYQIKPEKRAAIPAVTHVDGSGRLQTVSRTTNPRYHRLISEFEQVSGVPVVLNTSFNEDEPIVCTPQQAIDCFQRTRMDVLFLGNYKLER
ncbi:MAG TPA: carbamoyltransferase C-terminal domain-containing protein [Terriglobales bacterium]|nr:carbamoyltransferase C-terminal domain-containing protein [Terriglobales bacterium]